MHNFTSVPFIALVLLVVALGVAVIVLFRRVSVLGSAQASKFAWHRSDIEHLRRCMTAIAAVAQSGGPRLEKLALLERMLTFDSSSERERRIGWSVYELLDSGETFEKIAAGNEFQREFLSRNLLVLPSPAAAAKK